MKITSDIRANLEKARMDQANTKNSKAIFGDMVQKHSSKLQSQQLQTLLKDIDVAGERLVNSRTFKDIAKYKTLVKRFMEEAVEFGMELNQSHHWTYDGQSRHLQLVKEVDESLISLTEDVMNKEKSRLDILGSIGEIKGLLINLYT
ncbi:MULTISPECIES: YaaR family protein [Bacillus]|uniref:YaaR family protein n=1 Tax=Bacillus TaxID=1386 RepID=UPI000BB73E59|nr:MULTISPECIES: YaaR family protein [Bacillus]